MAALFQLIDLPVEQMASTSTNAKKLLLVHASGQFWLWLAIPEAWRASKCAMIKNEDCHTPWYQTMKGIRRLKTIPPRLPNYTSQKGTKPLWFKSVGPDFRFYSQYYWIILGIISSACQKVTLSPLMYGINT